MNHKQNTASQYDRDLEMCEELRSKFTANAEEFDSLMVRMLEMNVQLIEKAQRCEELERVLQLCIGYLDLDDAHEAHAFEEAKELLK